MWTGFAGLLRSKSADIAPQRLLRTGAARLLRSKSADPLNFKEVPPL